MAKKPYDSPKLVCYGPIVDHTFATPGAGDKSSDTSFLQDGFNEYSHPAS